MQPIINVDNLSYYYDSFPSLDHVSFSVEKGDFLGIIGPNGAGKTTLFQCILGILNNFSGEISLFGSNIKQNKKFLLRIGYVPQKKSVEQSFPATVSEIVSLGVMGRDIKKESIESAIDFVESWRLSKQENRRTFRRTATKGNNCESACEATRIIDIG